MNSPAESRGASVYVIVRFNRTIHGFPLPGMIRKQVSAKQPAKVVNHQRLCSFLHFESAIQTFRVSSF